MEQVKDILCVECRNTFTDEETATVTECPACGTTGLPALVSDSLTIKITRHELRILTHWASNYAHSIVREDQTMDPVKAVQGIVQGIREQSPDAGPLTLHEELQDVADAFQSKVESTLGDFTPKTRH